MKSFGLLVASLLISILIAELVLGFMNMPPLFRYYSTALEEVEAEEWSDWWVVDTPMGMKFDPSKLTAKKISELADITPNWRRLSTINSDGYHDQDQFVRPVRHAPDAQRFLFLGDSFTWGASAGIGKSFAEIFEQRLHEFDPQGLVWNAAIPATANKQDLAVLRQYLPIMEPTSVIVGFFENDLYGNLSPLDSFRQTKSGLAISRYSRDPLQNTVHLLSPDDIKNRLQNLIERKESGLYRFSRTARLVREVFANNNSAPRAVSELEKEVTRNLFMQIQEACTTYKSSLVVLLIPSRTSLEGDRPTNEYQAMLELVQDLNIRYIDPKGQLDLSDYNLFPDGHWNDAGHLKAAKLLEAELISYQ